MHDNNKITDWGLMMWGSTFTMSRLEFICGWQARNYFFPHLTQLRNFNHNHNPKFDPYHFEACHLWFRPTLVISTLVTFPGLICPYLFQDRTIKAGKIIQNWIIWRNFSNFRSSIFFCSALTSEQIWPRLSTSFQRNKQTNKQFFWK